MMGNSAKTYKYSIYIVAAAFFWGMIGIFVKGLDSLGLTSMEIVTIRVMFSAVFLFLIGMVTSKQREMKISFRHIYLFFGTGVMSIAFFNWAYFTSMQMISISVAVILLYTAPAFVMVMSVLFLGEKLTGMKVALLLLTMAGCFLVTGITGGAGIGEGRWIGYLIGLGSGFGYALYTIFGKFAIRKYSSFTVSFFTFLVASVFLVPLTEIWNVLPLLFNVKGITLVLGLSLVSSVLAYILYTEGLKEVEGSKASILATVEPVAAMMTGFLIFQEKIGGLQLAGAAIIIISSVLASINLPRLIRERKASLTAGVKGDGNMKQK